MDWQNYYVLALAALTILLLVFEKAHLSVLGIALMVAVTIPGLVDPDVAISGLSQPALVTIAALFIVGEGFLRTGAASFLAEKVLERTGNSESAVTLLVMVMAAALSAFVNNTLVVVTFLPVITTICRHANLFPSRLLIPLSYGSILGGLCTLVGTSTNLLVSGSLKAHDKDPLTMFSMTGPGLFLAGTGILYLAIVGRRLLPKIPSLSTQMAAGAMKEYVMEITIGEGSKLIGQPVREVGKNRTDSSARAMMLVRHEALVWPPFDDLTVQQGDVLMVSGPITELSTLQVEARAGGGPDQYDPGTMSFFELAISPVSAWVGRRVGDVALKSQFGAVVVALQRSGRHIRDRVSSLTLHGGDVLLAFGDDRSKAYLRQSDDFHMIEGIDQAIHRTEKAPWSFAIIVMVIALFVSNVVHYSTAALMGALGMILTRCITVRQAHRAIRWPIIFFIAGMFGLSQALDSTGTAALIGDLFVHMVPGGGAESPALLLLVLLVGTVFLTEFLTNNAVAILMVPVALEIAKQANLDHMPFVIAVLFGASCCFANPIGYQTNLMVLGPGGYRFRNFVKVGLPLDFLLAAVGVLVIPWFWPLEGPRPTAAWVNEQGQKLGDDVVAGSRVALKLKLPQPSHVYVASYSLEHGLVAMWPSKNLHNDLKPEQALQGQLTLPGTDNGTSLMWPIDLEVEGVEFAGISLAVIVSTNRLEDVEHDLFERALQLGNPFVQERDDFGLANPSLEPDFEPPSRGWRGDSPILRAALGTAPDNRGRMAPYEGLDGVYVATKVLEVH